MTRMTKCWKASIVPSTRKGPGGGGLQSPQEPQASSRRGPGGGGRPPPVSSRAPSLIKEEEDKEGASRTSPRPHGGEGQDKEVAEWTRRLRAPSLIKEEDGDGARRRWTPCLLKSPRPHRGLRRGHDKEVEEGARRRSAPSLLESPQPHGGGGQDEVGARRTRRL